MSVDRCFFDTNIFIYELDKSNSEKRTIASQLIRTALLHDTGRISYQVAQEFLQVGLKKFATAMTPHAASIHVRNILAPMLAIESSLALFDEALDIHARYKLSWYDSLIVAAALKAECTVLYTEDLQHNQRFGNLLVTNPFL